MRLFLLRTDKILKIEFYEFGCFEQLLYKKIFHSRQ